jgi:hypothetical protein
MKVISRTRTTSTSGVTFIWGTTSSPEEDRCRTPSRAAYFSGEETEAVHVMGKVLKRSKRWNAPWSFHLAPESIEFFAFAIEVCDASIQYVENHLDEVGGAFLPGSVWCPWGSRLLEEIPRP